jgi:predicted acyl esterase
MTPAAIRQSSSLYLKMRDGVEIAVIVYLPVDLKAAECVPLLMRTTRYWGVPRIGWPARMLVALHLVGSDATQVAQVARKIRDKSAA